MGGLFLERRPQKSQRLAGLTSNAYEEVLSTRPVGGSIPGKEMTPHSNTRGAQPKKPKSVLFLAILAPFSAKWLGHCVSG